MQAHHHDFVDNSVPLSKPVRSASLVAEAEASKESEADEEKRDTRYCHSPAFRAAAYSDSCFMFRAHSEKQTATTV